MWDPNKVQMEPCTSSMDTNSVAEECTTTNGHTVDARRVSMDGARDDEMVVMDTGRHVDYISEPIMENCRGVAPNGIVMDTVVMDTNRPVVETIKVSTTPVKQIIRATVTRQSSFVDNTHTLTRMNSGGSHPHAMYNGDAFARRESMDNPPASFARRESVENTTPVFMRRESMENTPASFARRESVENTPASFARQQSIENTSATAAAALPVTTETTRHIAEQCVNTIKRSPRSNGKIERTPPPVHKKPAPLVGKKPVPPPTPPKSVAVLHAHTNEFPAPPSPHTLQAFQLDSIESTKDVCDGAVSRNRFSNRTSTPTTPSRGSFKKPHTPPAIPTKPRPMSPRPVSSPTPESPQPNGGGLPWHRRTSSGPISPVISVVKPKPPPPPKRGLHTKLSFHGDTAQSKNFMADLQRTLEQKQRPSVGNKPPFTQRTDSVGDLPPPPPEVMTGGVEEGSGKRKLPPPPPRRSNATHLTPNK